MKEKTDATVQKIANKFSAGSQLKLPIGNFVYPIHGGDMGPTREVKRLSYGKFNWYDSIAPEFQTYETIKELAQNKSKGI